MIKSKNSNIFLNFIAVFPYNQIGYIKIFFFDVLQYQVQYNKAVIIYGGVTNENIHVKFSDEQLITPSGLVFVGQILGKSGFVKKINRAPVSGEYLQKQIKNGDIQVTYIGML